MSNKFNRKFCNLSSPINRDGFSLVEILMVLMVLTVGIIPLAVIQHQARQDVVESDIYTQNLNVAQSQLERIKGLGFGVAAPDSGVIGNVQWVARVNNVSFGLDRIEVTTTWTNGGGNQSITVADMVSLR